MNTPIPALCILLMMPAAAQARDNEHAATQQGDGGRLPWLFRRG